MKTVGKQLQEARLAKNWTPELAARETKIKVDRLRDLEADDYSHFTSPTYARGFVRTYARSLGLDEYKILRQLDNKLPDDDSANIVTDSGVAYLPETTLPPRAAHRDYTGLYIVMGLGAVITLVIVVVLIEAYRVGELKSYFSGSTETVAATTTKGANAAPADTTARALPIDSNTPPPVPVADATTNAPAPTAAPAADTNAPTAESPKALPVDSTNSPALATAPSTNTAPASDVPEKSVKALPVDPSELTNGTASATTPPRALPVNPDELAAASTNAPTIVAVNTPPAATPTPPPTPVISSTARQSNSGPVMEPSLPAVAPSTAATAPAAPADATTNTAAITTPDAEKPLILTASEDSFVRVTNLDAQAEKPLYAAVLHSGQSIGFDGHKFSINVGVPSAVDIKLDGVNYGPHSDRESPETFNVESHLR